jgi:transitional endoplasmic reticulum ATPase
MTDADDPTGPLREALRVSPDNIPLRLHLADALTRMARHKDAIAEYRQALSSAPHDEDIKRTLAESYFSNGQISEALVIVEDLIRTGEQTGAAHLLHARILLSKGDGAGAVREYRRAIDEDPDVADPELAERLGIDPEEDADVYEGQMRLGGGPTDAAPEITPLQKVLQQGGYATFGAGKLFHHPAGFVDRRGWDAFFLRNEEQKQ